MTEQQNQANAIQTISSLTVETKQHQPVEPVLPYIAASETSESSSDIQVLYVTRQGVKVHWRHGRIEISDDDECVLSVPQQEVDCIMCFGGVQVTKDVLVAAFNQSISIIYCNQYGSFKGVIGAVAQQTPRLLNAALALHQAPMAVAQLIVKSKLHNSMVILKRKLRYTSQQLKQSYQHHMTQLLAMKNKVDRCHTVDELLGVEGQGAKLYFHIFAALLPREFEFNQRNRRPPKDPVNALLSLGYSLLYGTVLTAIHAQGLPLSCGMLHRQCNQPCVALDMMEAFRAPIVDVTVLNLLAQGALSPADFEQTDKGCWLSKSARQVYFSALQQTLVREMQHPDTGTQMDHRRLMFAQVESLKKHMLEPSTPFKPFVIR